MTQRTAVFHPYNRHAKAQARDIGARLDEAAGLARAIDLDVEVALAVPLALTRPSTLFGKGKVEELGALISGNEVTLAVVDGKLSPVQQRNLEKEWNCKVIDRTALILEIFGARAATREGKLQVELAALNYQKTRLVRSWTHLERQRGGFGFLGGPGESQIEIDRRLIRDRIAKLKRELSEVTRTRELHRKKRRDVPYPVIALVGYTNAGKSTLFNKLTGAGVLSVDKLFATLDPTMRALHLPNGITAILSDTVGFVSDLPHELVAAFRATLEEVLEADLMLHVRDIAHPDTAAQKADVEEVLTRLFDTEHLPENVVEVLNKIDLLDADQREVYEKRELAVSAVSGEGMDALVAYLARHLENVMYKRLHYNIPVARGDALAWIHAHGKVVAEETDAYYIHAEVMLSDEDASRFQKIFSLESSLP